MHTQGHAGHWGKWDNGHERTRALKGPHHEFCIFLHTVLFSSLHCHLPPIQSRFVNTQSFTEYPCFCKMGVSERNWFHFDLIFTFCLTTTSRLVLLVPPGSTSSLSQSPPLIPYLDFAFGSVLLGSVGAAAMFIHWLGLVTVVMMAGIPKRKSYNKCSVNCTDQHKSLHAPLADTNEGRDVPLI